MDWLGKLYIISVGAVLALVSFFMMLPSMGEEAIPYVVVFKIMMFVVAPIAVYWGQKREEEKKHEQRRH